MGLDLTVRVQSDFRTDELGRDIWTVTQLCNLRKCHHILDKLSARLDGGFSNCATYSFYGETFHKIMEEMKEERTSLDEELPTEYVENRKSELDYNIEMLENFIAQNNVPNDDTESYEVHAWW